jgi:hypothetical protein
MLDTQAEAGAIKGYKNVVERLPAAREKLSLECLRIGLLCLREGDLEMARQYRIFSELLYDGVHRNEKYVKLCEGLAIGQYIGSDAIEDDMFVKRKRGYDPPAGYVAIRSGGINEPAI